MIGKIIDNYKVVNILGEGGMGIVYKAFDLKLERFVALKILNSQALTNPNYIARFKREAKNQAKLNHSNIVPVYGFTEDAETFGIVMEYVEGETLEHLISRKGHLELSEALLILRQILIGVGYAHSKGFVHRDIKPSNIIINTEGIVKIMDFGISKSMNESTAITRTGVKVGTLLYMSPEQVRAYEPTNQSDIYSIGITFYEMLLGRAPFDYDSDYQIMEAHLNKYPIKLSSQFSDIPPEVDSIIIKALQKSLDKRYRTCDELLIDADNFYKRLISPQPQKKIRKKEKTVTRAVPSYNEADKIPVKKPVMARIKFYLLAIVVAGIFCALFYFVYSTISQFWKMSENANAANTEQGSGAASAFHWKKISSPTVNSLNSIYFWDDNLGFSCGAKGTLLKTTDGGYSWTAMGDSSGIDFYDVRFISSTRGFVVGEKGSVLSTNDGGYSWQKFNYDTTISLFKIVFLKDSYTGFIVGGRGTILRTNDGGVNWFPVASPSQELLYNISFANNDGIITGWNGTILKTTDRGKTWTAITKVTDSYLRGVCINNDNAAIIAGGSGTILRSDDGGTAWNKINSNSYSGFCAVYFSHNNTGFILGNKGEILISKDNGKSWDAGNSGIFSSLTAITETPSGKIFISSNDGSVIKN